MYIQFLVAGIFLELVFPHIPILWRTRKISAGVLVMLTVAGAIWTAITSGLIVSLSTVIIGAFRIVNLYRVNKERLHDDHLKEAVGRTSGFLCLFQILVLYLGFIPESTLIYMASFVVSSQIFFGTVFLSSVINNMRRMTAREINGYHSDKELPTVSVAVPARNETDDLKACIESLLANDYPKLEILVLDDCSHDTTAKIIKSYAHDGVRFIKGTEPSDRWLAKNHAYDKLNDHATGEYILFCGVDIRLGPSGIRQIVENVLTRKKEMISILPKRYESNFFSGFIQPMRYWWELSLPRRLLNRPAVLSSCWIINRDVLKKLGGFDGVQRKIIPERYFARKLVGQDKYSFLRTTNNLDVHTVKNLHDQKDTAIRTAYPKIKKRPENTFITVASLVILFIAPFISLLSWTSNGGTPLAFISGTAFLLLLLTHLLIMQFTNPAQTLAALINFPIAIILEIGIQIVSMMKYEFGKVEWKDRNICIPVMEVYDHLPEIR